MRQRKLSLTARLANELERATFALRVLLSTTNEVKEYPNDLCSEREAFAPSVEAILANSAALVAEQRARGTAQ